MGAASRPPPVPCVKPRNRKGDGRVPLPYFYVLATCRSRALDSLPVVRLLTTPEQLAAKLKALGIRQTPQRLAIAEVVVNSGDHPSVKEIYQRVKEFFPYVTLATVYSTLETLEQAGIVRALPFQKQSRYDANLSPHATWCAWAAAEWWTPARARI